MPWLSTGAMGTVLTGGAFLTNRGGEGRMLERRGGAAGGDDGGGGAAAGGGRRVYTWVIGGFWKVVAIGAAAG